MNIGIVYATGSGMVRRWIVPDNDADLQKSHPLAPGETMLVVDAKVITSPADVDAAVAKAIGKQVPSPRCAVVDQSGAVVDVIMADPALDTVSGHTLTPHATADKGWTLQQGVLTAPPVTIVADGPPNVGVVAGA